MNALTEEHTRRAMELSNDNTLGTVDHECAVICHVRNSTQEDILDERTKVLVIRIGTI